MKKIFSLLLIFAVASVSILFSSFTEAFAGTAAPITKVSIDRISSDGVNWESLNDSTGNSLAVKPIEGDTVYFRVTYTGISNTNIFYNDTLNITNSGVINYQQVPITDSAKVVVGYQRYYSIPVSAFENGYKLRIHSYSAAGPKQADSNTVFFSLAQ
ncbi:DUF4879 domain-containing protein [Rummeliibacillus sp. TYF-LIM-RU47]|uniref:DUF4879 domain-containing protein n=1 Tax=Rummeliibacillus sp. TYF-LIM-RU47 TaxID=2608406 RepID=UPI00167FF032|nr:DUF4879 domain-containing protein [Rummeliibacillus sp. TYF-LIM-RU47]